MATLQNGCVVSSVIERQAKDQLPGGKYWTQSSDEHLPSTNNMSERDFAQLDILLSLKPSASTTTFESIIMWTNNKTSSWLQAMNEEERKEIIENARKNVPEMRKNQGKASETIQSKV